MGDKISSRLAAQRARGGRGAGHDRGPQLARRGGGVRRGARLAGRHQGRLRRGRPGHAGRPRAPPRRRPPWSPRSGRPRRRSGGSESYLERYLTWPRHVEVQVFADTPRRLPCTWAPATARPSAVTRSSSRRRRRRRSPAPTLDAMGEAAVKVARACGYVNAGTVEFIYQDGDFYLPGDEHPAAGRASRPPRRSSAGTWWPSSCASPSGEPLGFAQDDVRLDGHAIEVRVNAEDPAGGRFLPSPGHHHPVPPVRTASGCAPMPATTRATPSASSTTT